MFAWSLKRFVPEFPSRYVRARDLFGTRPALKILQPCAVNCAIARIAATYIRVACEHSSTRKVGEHWECRSHWTPLCDENERQCNRGRPEGERKSNIDLGWSEDCSDPQRAKHKIITMPCFFHGSVLAITYSSPGVLQTARTFACWVGFALLYVVSAVQSDPLFYRKKY